MSEYNLIEYEVNNKIAIIRLNDPDSLNSISKPMGLEIRDALGRCSNDANALVLTGNGRAFSSGANLNSDEIDMQDKDRDLGVGLEEYFNPMIMQLRHLPIPFISAVRGAVAGVGCSIALMADIIIASKNAYFMQAFCKIGLIPDGGSAYLLARTIGRARAMELMLLGEKYSAEQAHSDGLINRIVEDDQLESTALEIAARLAEGPTTTLQLIRASAWAALDSSLEEQLDRERKLQTDAGRSDDFAEGLSAFLEKRPAKFDGK